MLRLTPSELTLTPEDVEEAFRRLSQRQLSRATIVASPRSSGPSARPVLLRGPQRSTQDAIVTLGNIPILRPSPQQAVYGSVEDDFERTQESQRGTPPTDHGDTRADTGPRTQAGHSALAFTAASSALRSMHLPFRLGRHRRTSNTDPTSNDASVQPPPRSPPSTLGNAARSPPRPATPAATHERAYSTGSPAGLRGGGQHRKCSTTATNQDTLRTTSLSQEAQKSNALQRQETSPHIGGLRRSREESRPTLYLRGYFLDSAIDPNGTSYHFAEFIPPLPQTEPRRRSGRQAVHTRSLSSGSAPTFAHPPRRPHYPRPNIDHAFRTALAPEHPSRLASSTFFDHRTLTSAPWSSIQTYDPSRVGTDRARPRQFSSEASNASAAFSYYGSDLLGSRKSSRERLGMDCSIPSPYDGAMASNDKGETMYMARHPRVNSISSDIVASPPLPERQSRILPPPLGYRRSAFQLTRDAPEQTVQSPLHSTPDAASTHGSRRHHLVEDDRAAYAAAHDLDSPLDNYARYYQNEQIAQQLQYRAEQQVRPIRHTLAAEPSAYHRHQFDTNMSRPGRAVNSSLQSVSYRATRVEATVSRSPSPSSSQSTHQPVSERWQPYGMIQRPTTDIQHSYDDDHTHEATPPQRAAISQGGAEVGSYISPGPLPCDVSNRRRIQPQHLPPSAIAHSHAGSRPRTSLPSISTEPLRFHRSMPYPPPPRLASQQHQFIGERPPTNTASRRPSRPSPRNSPESALNAPNNNSASAIANGNTVRSRYVPIAPQPPPRNIRPRIPAHQLDQENSGEGEMTMMRAEEAAVQARYGGLEGARQDVMDETPPRVGRVERRMFD